MARCIFQILSYIFPFLGNGHPLFSAPKPAISRLGQQLGAGALGPSPASAEHHVGTQTKPPQLSLGYKALSLG